MRTVINLVLSAYYHYRALFPWLNWWAFAANAAVRPALMVALFSLLGRYVGDAGAAQSYAVGLAAHSMVWVLSGGVIQSAVGDRAGGTLTLSLAASGSRAALYFSKGVLHAPGSLLPVAVSLAAGWLFLGLPFASVHWGLLIVATLTMAASLTAFMLFVANLAVVAQNWDSFRSIVAGGFLALSGVVIPTSALPMGLRELSATLPISHGLSAFRGSFEGMPFSVASETLIAEAVVMVAHAIGGYLLFRVLAQISRRTGGLITD